MTWRAYWLQSSRLIINKINDVVAWLKKTDALCFIMITIIEFYDLQAIIIKILDAIILKVLNSITFIHFKDYMMINDIEANIMNSMNLSRSSMNHTSVKLAKTTDWFSNIISSTAMRTQSSKLHIRRWNAFFIYYIYIARIMIIYNSLKHTRHYHLYLSNCLALLIINRESYCLILHFVINHSLHALMWWIDLMRSFWSRFLISSWLHMFKSCRNVFFMFFIWDEICKLKLFNCCILTKL